MAMKKAAAGQPEARAPATTRTHAKKPTAKSDGFCVYLGPSIRGVIQEGTIYPGTRQAVLKRLSGVVKEYPAVADLVVTGATLPVDRVRVKTPGNLLYKYYTDMTKGGKPNG